MTAVQRRAHGLRRRALHSLSLALARHPRLVACARAAARARRQRLARIALIRDLVLRLSSASPRNRDLPAALLLAMLRAAGERARVEYTRESTLVRVAVARGDVRRLPPWARLAATASGILEIVVAPEGCWTSAGYLPPVTRVALDRRRPPAPTALAS